MPPGGRWALEQVVAIAPGPASIAAAEPLADRTRWTVVGVDGPALWGRIRGGAGEPYEVIVDHRAAVTRCSCPSRRVPCKHALALLLLWIRDGVPEAAAPEEVERWLARTGSDPGPPPADVRSGTGDGDATGDVDVGSADGRDTGERPPTGRDERVARARDGLRELDRWLEDRIRIGLSDPSLARYDTWDTLAARLVDAGAGSLATRVRRLAGRVGVGTRWREEVLTEIGLLHLLVHGGLRTSELPDDLGDAVATATGWQVRRADVLAGVADTDDWVVAGRSDRREDRIEVRRTWLWGRTTHRWAMVLSFAAYGQALDDTLTVGTAVQADLFRYPGTGLRALVGEVTGTPVPSSGPEAVDVRTACDHVGLVVAAEPWIDRLAVTILAAPTCSGGRWVLTDHTGSLPVEATPGALAPVLAATLGEPAAITVEWTPDGVVPLSVHLPDRTLDVGPRADPSFVASVLGARGGAR